MKINLLQLIKISLIMMLFILLNPSSSWAEQESLPESENPQKFVEARDLTVGDTVFVEEENTLKPERIVEKTWVNEPANVYNLRVDNDNTFFANDIAVHNKLPYPRAYFYLDADGDGTHDNNEPVVVSNQTIVNQLNSLYGAGFATYGAAYFHHTNSWYDDYNERDAGHADYYLPNNTLCSNSGGIATIYDDATGGACGDRRLDLPPNSAFPFGQVNRGSDFRVAGVNFEDYGTGSARPVYRYDGPVRPGFSCGQYDCGTKSSCPSTRTPGYTSLACYVNYPAEQKYWSTTWPCKWEWDSDTGDGKCECSGSSSCFLPFYSKVGIISGGGDVKSELDFREGSNFGSYASNMRAIQVSKFNVSYSGSYYFGVFPSQGGYGGASIWELSQGTAGNQPSYPSRVYSYNDISTYGFEGTFVCSARDVEHLYQSSSGAGYCNLSSSKTYAIIANAYGVGYAGARKWGWPFLMWRSARLTATVPSPPDPVAAIPLSGEWEPPPAPGTIRVRAWNESSNCTWDSGESGNDVSVAISGGPTSASGSTGSDGVYTKSVTAGSGYTVTISNIPSGYSVRSACLGTLGLTCNADGSQCWKSNITVSEGGTATVNFPLVMEGSVIGRVWEEVTGNCGYSYSGGDRGMGGITVTVANNTTNAVVATASTLSNGSYTINVSPGTYRVRITVPNDFEVPEEPQDCRANFNSCPGENQQCTKRNVVVTAGGSITVNFPLVELFRVSGLVWDNTDVSTNCSQNPPNEPGLAGWTVTILNPYGSNSTTTDGSGNYTINNVPSFVGGTGYQVCVTPPVGEMNWELDCTRRDGANAGVAGFCTNSFTHNRDTVINFGMFYEVDPWIQTSIGNVASRFSILDPIPNPMYVKDFTGGPGESYLSRGVSSSSPGVVTAQTSLSIDLNQPDGEVNSKSWEIPGIIPTGSYDVTTNLSQYNYSGLYNILKANIGTTIQVTDTDVAIENNVGFNNKSATFLIDGNLFINSDFTQPNGFYAFIVSGDIIIDPSVTEIKGIFLADGTISTGDTTDQDRGLSIEGMMIAWNGFNLDRDWIDNRKPAEYVLYNPRFLVSLRDSLGESKIRWREI